MSGMPADLAFRLERVTGIEPALSAWESDRSGSLTGLTWAPDAPLQIFNGGRYRRSEDGRFKGSRGTLSARRARGRWR